MFINDNYPPISEPRPVRIKFEKGGKLIYISHLDLNRTMTHTILRAGIPLWFTEGFNPRPKLIFATPLSVGAASMCEYLDIKVIKDIPESEIMDRLNRELPADIRIIEVYRPERKFSDIEYSSYNIDVRDKSVDRGTADRVKELFAKPLLLIKKSKSGDREVDITRYIKSIAAISDEGVLHITAELSANSTDFLNPEYVITALKKYAGIPGDDLIHSEYDITRTGVYDKDGKEFK